MTPIPFFAFTRNLQQPAATFKIYHKTLEIAEQNTMKSSLLKEKIDNYNGLEIYFDLRLNEKKSGESWNTYDVFDFRLGIDSPTIISFRANNSFSALNQKKQIEAQLIAWLECIKGKVHGQLSE